MNNPNVHAYKASREVRLQHLVQVLWNHMNSYQHADLGPSIVRAGMGWAIPEALTDHRDQDDWLTVDQLAYELGLSRSAIRNWQQRYGLTPVRGTYRWGDVQRVLADRHQRKQNPHAG